MTHYGQYCPVSRALEIVGDRWTLLVVRDVLTGVHRFNDLARGLPRMSRSLLSHRLKRLERAGIVERATDASGGRAYRPTEAGRDLWPVVESLMAWGARWAFDEPDEADLDPLLLMWWIRRGVAPDRLPEARGVIEFAFVDDERGPYWLVVRRGDVSLCLDPPPFDVDVRVTTDKACLYGVWLGRTAYEEATASGRLEVRGTPALEAAFPAWFTWSPAAPWVRGQGGVPAAATPSMAP